MHRFKKIDSTLYQYRDADVILRFDNYDNASMLAKIKVESGNPAQFYTHSYDFERVKKITIDKINSFLDQQPSGTD